jgi:DNA-binding CsgD family transcriptional regulator
MLSASIVRDAAGDPCYFVAQIQDISARKAAEKDSARRLRHVERLTHTMSAILHAFECTPDDIVFSKVLKILLDALESRAGIFLRFADDGVLVGRYLSPDEDRDARCAEPYACSLWEATLLDDKASIENHSRPMGCGRLVSRSVVAPIRHDGAPLGLLHIGDAQTDYDADDLDLLTRISDMIAPVVQARLERDKLTPREAEVMDLIISGRTQKQIAADLAISIQTAAKHRAKVLDKLHLHNDVELVHFAMDMRRLPTLSSSIGPARPKRESK